MGRLPVAPGSFSNGRELLFVGPSVKLRTRTRRRCSLLRAWVTVRIPFTLLRLFRKCMLMQLGRVSKSLKGRESQVPMSHTSLSPCKCRDPRAPTSSFAASWRAGRRACEAVLCHPGNLPLQQDSSPQKRFSNGLEMHRRAALEFDKEAVSGHSRCTP